MDECVEKMKGRREAGTGEWKGTGWKTNAKGNEGEKEKRRKGMKGERRSEERHRDKFAFLSGKSILKGNFTRISSWVYYFFWSCSLRRLQKVGMNRGCWILLWLMYDCQQWSREIMHVWSKTCSTHTYIYISTHLNYQLVWWVAPGQIVCPLRSLQSLMFLFYIPSFCFSLFLIVCPCSFFLLTFLSFPKLPQTLCRNTHTLAQQRLWPRLAAKTLNPSMNQRPKISWCNHGDLISRSTSCNHNVTSRSRKLRTAESDAAGHPGAGWQRGCS